MTGYYYKRRNYVFMKGNIGILMVIAVMCPPCLSAWGMPVIDGGADDEGTPVAPTVEALVRTLDVMAPFSAQVDYDVSLPMLDDDVVYSIELASDTVAGDPLSAVDYLIKWSLPGKEGGEPSSGWLLYTSPSPRD